MDLNVDLANRFSYHPPKTEDVKNAHEWVRNTLLRVAGDFDIELSPGREKSLAITHLEEAMFWANASIARNQ